MQQDHASCTRASARQALVAFSSAQHKFGGHLLGNEARLTRRRHRSCIGSAPGARGQGGAHEGGGGGGSQGETAAKTPAPVLGWSARMGTKKLKQVNVSRERVQEHVDSSQQSQRVPFSVEQVNKHRGVLCVRRTTWYQTILVFYRRVDLAIRLQAVFYVLCSAALPARRTRSRRVAA